MCINWKQEKGEEEGIMRSSTWKRDDLLTYSNIPCFRNFNKFWEGCINDQLISNGATTKLNHYKTTRLNKDDLIHLRYVKFPSSASPCSYNIWHIMDWIILFMRLMPLVYIMCLKYYWKLQNIQNTIKLFGHTAFYY